MKDWNKVIYGRHHSLVGFCHRDQYSVSMKVGNFLSSWTLFQRTLCTIQSAVVKQFIEGRKYMHSLTVVVCWPPFNILTVLLNLRRQWKLRLYFSLLYNRQKEIKCVYSERSFIQNFIYWKVAIYPSLYFPSNLTSVINTLIFLGGSKQGAVYFIVWNAVWKCFFSLLFYFFHLSSHYSDLCYSLVCVYTCLVTCNMLGIICRHGWKYG
jgi:hypothetical protein